jgi:hypothetical protein
MSSSLPILVLGITFVFLCACGASSDTAAVDQLLVPDSTGWVDKSVTGTTGIQGQWHGFPDTHFAVIGVPAGTCQSAASGECSIISEPVPGAPYGPTAGRGMCASGIIARWIANSDGLTPDGSPGWAGIALDLNLPDWPAPRMPTNIPAGSLYDALAHGVTGFAFDIDPPPAPGAPILVGVQTDLGEPPLAYGGDASGNWSSVHARHNEWSFVGQPFFLAKKGQPTLMLRLGFVARGSDSQAVRYSFCVNNLTVLHGSMTPPLPPRPTSGRQLLEPDQDGWVDGSTTGDTGIQGGWFVYGDRDMCERAGYAKSECSVVIEPALDAPTYSPTPGLGMCTSGVVAQAPTGPDGQPDYTNVFGAGIGLSLNIPTRGPPQVYDATHHGVTGFSFEIEPEPAPGAEIRVQVDTEGGVKGVVQTLWAGGINESSPVHAGYNEFRLEDLQLPSYASDMSAVYLTRLYNIHFAVPSNAIRSESYSYCIKNLTALRH